jgi:hypothetical protein
MTTLCRAFADAREAHTAVERLLASGAAAAALDGRTGA